MAASHPLHDTFAATQHLGTQAPAFVGRSWELAELTSALHAAPVPPGPVRLISGSPGIGKTRLALELASAAEHDGIDVVWGYCIEETGKPPYWPWTQVVRQLLGQDRGTDLAELVLEEPTDADRFELFDAVAATLGAVAARRRLLVVLDDLHEADPPTLLLTRFIARQLQDRPLLIVATMRPVKAGDAAENGASVLADEVESLRRLGHEMPLTGLDVDAVGQMMADPEHGSAVHTITAGNPLYVEQVVRGASGRTSLSLTEDRKSVGTLDGLRRAVRSRIAELDPVELEVLQAAATLGLRHSVDELVQLVSATFGGGGRVTEEQATSEPSTLHIERLVAVGVLARSPVEGLEFTHPLIAEVALTTVSSNLGELLHGNAADLISGDRFRLSEQASHLLQAGAPRRDDAVAACWSAADAATRSLAHEDGAAHYVGALDALEDSTDRDAERLSLLLLLGDSLWRSGRHDEAAESFEEGWQVATKLGDPESLARAALRNGIEYYFAESPHPIWRERVEEALDRQPAGDSCWRAKLLAQFATHHLDSTRSSNGTGSSKGTRGSTGTGNPRETESRDVSRTPDARLLARQSLEMARRVGEPLALGYALVATQVSDLGPETLRRRISGADEILACARESGDYRLSLHGRFMLMGALLESGDVRRVDSELATQYDIVEELGEPRFTRFVLWFRAMRALLDGYPVEAEELAEQCLAISQGIGDPDGPAVYGGQIGIARWMQGRIEEVEELFLDLRAAEPGEPLWAAVLAWLWAGQGQFTAARGALSDISDVTSIPRSLNWLITMTALADAVATAGDIEQVAEVWSELLPYDDRVVPVGMGAAVWGTVARPLGRLALRLGKVEQGLNHLAQAVEICARLGARPWLIEAQLELASALMTQRPSDLRIPELITEARNSAAHLELDLFLEEAAELEARAVSVGAQGATIDPGGRAEASPVPHEHAEATPSISAARPSVRVMGTFEVSTPDGMAAKWSSRKARELLKILVARRGVPILRESLMDLLWPGEDPALLGNRLSVAMSTVRRALDPEKIFDADDLLSTASDTAVLRLDAVDVDVERFLESAQQIIDTSRSGADLPGLVGTGADTAHGSVTEQAYLLMRSYGGEALPDEPHADWAMALRDEVRARYVALARLVAQGAQQVGDHMRSSEAFRRVLDVDPYDERAHLGLVRAFREMSAHGQADATYAVYLSRMGELGITPGPEADGGI